ncbi:MFS multidrug transporter [Lecanosticta acicola]|uniref:MFS multidrug transporter n=1 Tax=Lecanosticta acicola TaxID=111012 RepID=A0AAI8W228_9PEZI|nr:MFS multidrug transporter [Lecanosticta acicola]
MGLYDSWDHSKRGSIWTSSNHSSLAPSGLELGPGHEDNTIMQEISEVEAFHRSTGWNGRDVKAKDSDNHEKEDPSSYDSESPPPKQGIKRAQTRQALKLSGWRLALTLPSVLIALLLATMDSSIVSTALVTIGNDFDDFAQTIWIVLGYLLSYMTFTMLWSRFSDIFGRKPIFIISLLALLGFSAGCGRAQTLNELIVFRVLQGLGGSGIYSLGNIVLPEITPDKWYAHMVTAQGGIFTISNVLGPVLGGVISAQTTWRWLFYLNLPGCGILLPILLIAWKDTKLDETLKTRLHKALNFDFLGLVLLTAATCCAVVGIQLGGSYYAPWTSATVVGTLVGALTAFLVLLGWNHHRDVTFRKTEKGPLPLFPRRLMTLRLVSASFMMCTLCGFNLFLAIVTLPQRYQVLNGDSSLLAGIRLLPFLATSAIGSTLFGIISARRNWTFALSMVASSFLLLGSGLLSIKPTPGKIGVETYFFQIFYGLGTGGLLSSTAYISGLNSNYEDYALSSGIISQCRILGGCIGLTLTTVVLNETFSKYLAGVLQPNELQELRQSLDHSAQLSPEKQAAVANAYADAFVEQFRMATYCAAIVLLRSNSLPSWVRRDCSSDKNTITDNAASMGENSQVNETLTAKLRFELPKHWEYVFVDASTTCIPAPGIQELFGEGPFYCHGQTFDVECVGENVEYIKEVIEDEGPFDGVFAFSQGAALIGSLILHHSLENISEPEPFRFGVFFSGTLPFSKEIGTGRDETKGFGMCTADIALESAGLDPQAFNEIKEDMEEPSGPCWQFIPQETSLRIEIPTVHCFDPTDVDYMRVQHQQLAKLCRNATAIHHGDGHTLPRNKKSIKEIAPVINDMVDKCGLLQ